MGIETIATPQLWLITLLAIGALLVLDFVVTRKPHEVSMREAIWWSVFYIALPVGFGVWLWLSHGSQIGIEYYTGYLVEKSLSVDNLFVFMILLSAFAVPKELQQRALLFGVIGALALRGVFIAVGATLISTFSWTFLLFGAVLLLTGAKLLRDAITGSEHSMEVKDVKSVQFIRRFFPVVDDYRGAKMTARQDGRLALTPFALVVIAILGTDIVFAVDSVPAVYGITGDPYLVFVTNAFALLGLRALYFVLEHALSSLVYLSYGLAAILGFIGVKLVLHWAHTVWPAVPGIPTLASLGVIVGILAVTIFASLTVGRRAKTPH